MIDHLFLVRKGSVNFKTVGNACRGPKSIPPENNPLVNRRANHQRKAVAVPKNTSRALVTRTNLASDYNNIRRTARWGWFCLESDKIDWEVNYEHREKVDRRIMVRRMRPRCAKEKYQNERPQVSCNHVPSTFPSTPFRPAFDSIAKVKGGVS